MSLSLLYPFYLENLFLNYDFRFENNDICCLYFGFATKSKDLTDMRALYLFCALSVSCFYSKQTKDFLNSKFKCDDVTPGPTLNEKKNGEFVLCDFFEVDEFAFCIFLTQKKL